MVLLISTKNLNAWVNFEGDPYMYLQRNQFLALETWAQSNQDILFLFTVFLSIALGCYQYVASLMLDS